MIKEETPVKKDFCFSGSHFKTIDGKNQIVLPQDYRKDLEGEALKIIPWFDRSLAILPISVWRSFGNSINTLGYDPEARGTRMSFFGGSASASFDSAGRMQIPPELQDRVRLTKEIVLVGDFDKILIMSIERYKDMIHDDTTNLNKNFEGVLNKVMKVQYPSQEGITG